MPYTSARFLALFLNLKKTNPMTPEEKIPCSCGDPNCGFDDKHGNTFHLQPQPSPIEAGEVNEAIAIQVEKAMDEEQGRWQDAIYQLLQKLVPEACVDGGGCDSGDPLDVTLSEIAQAISHLKDQNEH
jgi:hypothetical protein